MMVSSFNIVPDQDCDELRVMTLNSVMPTSSGGNLRKFLGGPSEPALRYASRSRAGSESLVRSGRPPTCFGGVSSKLQ